MSLTTLIYSVATAINLFVLYTLFRRSQIYLATWKQLCNTRQFIRLSITCLLALICWLLWVFLFYNTVWSWYISLDPGLPKPHFLLIWIINLVLLLIAMGLAERLRPSAGR